MIKYTKSYLNKLEEILAETQFTLRYEKGNFKSGYCVLKDTKIALVNKFYTLEGKINSLVDIIKLLEVDPEQLSEKNRKILIEVLETPSAT